MQYGPPGPNHFRLKIGQWQFADAVFPPAIERGVQASLSHVGNVVAGQPASLTAGEVVDFLPAPWLDAAAGNRLLRHESNAPTVEIPPDGNATAAWDAKLAADQLNRVRSYRGTNRESQTKTPQATPAARGLAKVCEAPNRLGHLDIAAVNLMCAGGLPHAEFNSQRILDWLDEAAHQADFQTRRHWYRFLDSPQTYNGSAGYFCCYHLLQTLQEDFGVRYNPARVKDPKFQDPKCIDPDFTDCAFHRPAHAGAFQAVLDPGQTHLPGHSDYSGGGCRSEG